MTSATMFDRIWRAHIVAALDERTDLLHIDRHLLQEMTSFKGFADLRSMDRKVHSPHLTIAVIDHILSTKAGRDDTSYPAGTQLIRLQRASTRDFGVSLIDIAADDQGIVHVIGPELGVTLPGATLVCGDSHTCTNGGLGALAFGIGASDVGHVLATQTMAMRRPRTLRISIDGKLQRGVYAKDLILRVIGIVGPAGGAGYAVEYAGRVVRAMTIDERLTLCNMSIELGARIGMVAPDDTTFEYLHGRRYVPVGDRWDQALAHWRTLPSAHDARFSREIAVDASDVDPQITWGTSPADTISIGGTIPDPAADPDPVRRAAKRQALKYMALEPGMQMKGLAIDQVFIGSCTNARLSDLREAARIARGAKVAPHVRAMVVPGSTAIKRAAEAEGIDRVLRTAGFEWHESACSMCAGVNDDHVPPGKRCVATSNRNFEGRQGRDARTHLASPATAAAAAIAGRIVDIREFLTDP